ncbi:MAG TPA: SxtJ family membrane protein [Woeseiaceae bacterium]|nr:SxtJ family membrane protein [Woeseiaceae bacterium]
MDHSIPELDTKGLRNFGVTTGFMIALLFGVAFPWFLGIDIPLWPWVIFAVLALLGVVVPNSLRFVYFVWMRFGLLMSRVMTPLVLGIVFFGLVLPMGIVMRLIRPDPMNRKLDDAAESYRVNSVKATRENLERPF